MNKKYIVYKHTCPNGKAYIGMTSNYKSRCYSHQQISGCWAFYDAVMFFGWDNIKHEILKSGLSKKLAKKYEDYFIRSNNCLYPNGYNLVLTGDKRPEYQSKNNVKNNEKKPIINLNINAHIARAMGLENCELARKIEALNNGKNPSYNLRTNNPRLFKPDYIAAQIEFWSDLEVIAAENRKKLEIEDGN